MTSFSKRYTQNKNFKHRYGITLQEYEAMWSDRRGQCDACGEYREFDPPAKEQRLYIDHCHKEAAEGNVRIRGLLCHHCNLLAGHGKDAPIRLAGILQYLNKDMYRDHEPE